MILALVLIGLVILGAAGGAFVNLWLFLFLVLAVVIALGYGRRLP